MRNLLILTVFMFGLFTFNMQGQSLTMLGSEAPCEDGAEFRLDKGLTDLTSFTTINVQVQIKDSNGMYMDHIGPGIFLFPPEKQMEVFDVCFYYQSSKDYRIRISKINDNPYFTEWIYF